MVDISLKKDSFANLAEQDAASGKNTGTSDSTSSISSSGDASANSREGYTKQELVVEPGVQFPPTSCYNYYYPGYDGAYPDLDDQSCVLAGDGLEMPYNGIQPDNGSLVYYMPGYNPYASGTLMGDNGQCVSQQTYFPSSRYFQPSVSYQSEAMPAGDSHNGTSVLVSTKPTELTPSPITSLKSKGSNSIKTDGTIETKISAPPSNPKLLVARDSANFSNSHTHSHPPKHANKVPPLGSGIRSAGLVKGYSPMGKFSSFSNRGQGMFPQNGPKNFRPNSRSLEGCYNRFKLTDKFNRNREFESSNELTRGPRANRNGVNSPLSSSTEKVQLSPSIRRDQYNLKDFQINYEQAMFFVIKSYSEDDVHKSIKFNVWASTPKGNEKLDAAFHEAERRSSEKGTLCPIFLFFSVNASGQFVGLAEMIGQVDFKKSMDFWQQDKWNGFFPIKWHIVKDIPNGRLRHIILENNENEPVTFSRDTQEVRFKQGSEMLNIFKSYPAKTSILDDFGFYEDRGKSLLAKRSSTALTHLDIKNADSSQEHLGSAARRVEAPSATRTRRASADPKQSLISLTKTLSLNSHSPKKNIAGNDSRSVKRP